MTTVAVVGAGIGGLSTALALAADGHQVTVLERAERFEAAGAGLVLTPNAVQSLAGLGVHLEDDAQVLTRLEVLGRSGRRLSVIDLARLTGTYGPTYGIARPRLHALLAGALPSSVEVTLGAQVTAVEATDHIVTVAWSGTERTFDVVVAADGLRSTVRPLVGGPQRLRYSRSTCWRGIVPLEVGSCAVESWGDGHRVGVVPVGAGQAYYYLVRVAPAAAPPPTSVAALQAVFAGHAGTAGHLVDSLVEIPPLHHDLFELDRPWWGRERVLLLGDAAHAMTPNQGQGAAMAVEDALAVARALRTGPAGALERYRGARARRVRRVQLTSRRLGTMASLRGAGTTRVREAAMRLAPSGAATTTMRRLVRSGMPPGPPDLA